MRRIHPLFVCLAIGIVSFSNAVAQSPGGDSEWSAPIDVTQDSNESDGAFFGVLACDPYQNSHLFWAEFSQEGAAIYYKNDVEGQWSAPVDVLALPEPVAAFLDVAISESDNSVHLIWKNMWIGGSLYHSRAPLQHADDPRAWSRPQMVAEHVDLASIESGTDGILHIVYGTSQDTERQNTVYYIRSEDDGDTWSDPLSVYSVISDLPAITRVATAIDDRGRLHVGVTLRAEEYGAYSEVGYLRSSSDNRTWSEYRRIDAGGQSFQGVARIAPYAFGEDEIHLTWSDPRRMHQWSSDGGNTWSNPVEMMPLPAAFGGFNQLVKDSRGTLHVVAAEAHGVFSAQQNGAGWGPPEPIDERRIDPHWQNMVVCQGNQLQVIYYDRTGDKRVWYASRQVEAPRIPQQPLPTSAPSPSTPPTSPTATAPEAQPTSSLSSSDYPETVAPPKPLPGTNPVALLSAPLAAALTLLAIVIFIHLRSRD